MTGHALPWYLRARGTAGSGLGRGPVGRFPIVGSSRGADADLNFASPLEPEAEVTRQPRDGRGLAPLGGRRLPALWADAEPDGRQALFTALFAKTEVLGFDRMEYEVPLEAVELGLGAALPATFEVGQEREFGRGERACPSLTQRSVRFLMINRTRQARLPAAAARSA